MVQPTPAVVARGVKQPSDFDRTTFRELPVKCHGECGFALVEAAASLEPNASSDMHLSLLSHADAQYRWKPVAERLLQHYRDPSQPLRRAILGKKQQAPHKHPGQFKNSMRFTYTS